MNSYLSDALSEAADRRCSVKKGLATLLKRDTNTGVFLWKLEIFKNTYFKKHLRTTSSGLSAMWKLYQEDIWWVWEYLLGRFLSKFNLILNHIFSEACLQQIQNTLFQCKYWWKIDVLLTWNFNISWLSNSVYFTSYISNTN